MVVYSDTKLVTHRNTDYLDKAHSDFQLASWPCLNTLAPASYLTYSITTAGYLEMVEHSEPQLATKTWLTLRPSGGDQDMTENSEHKLAT